jgi:anthranilate synthase/aminodeoxychorismate synthase-like glutamine amidotransferase
MILVIDNYDSFTYNLVQYIGELTTDVQVVRNDRITLSEITELRPSHIVLSPGPGRPENAGICIKLLKKFYKTIPIFGVCLGHQAIGYAMGARIVNAGEIYHGKTSMIQHDGKSVFRGIENPFRATRYHSLVIDPATLPDTMIVTAKTDSGIIMGIRNTEYPVEGVQFHPESFLTASGKTLLRNFLNIKSIL